MSDAADTLKDSGDWLVVAIICIGLATGSAMFLAADSDSGREVADITEAESAVLDSASVIDYEELSEAQQSEFRDAMVSEEVVKEDADLLLEHDYVYLDGSYYTVESETLRSTVSIVFGATALVTVLVGGLIGSLFLLKGILMIVTSFLFYIERSDEFIDWLESDHSDEAVVLFILLLVAIVSVPFVFGISSVALSEVNPESADIDSAVEASELSEAEREVFYDLVADEPITRPSGTLADYTFIKSDGEYYEVRDAGYPLNYYGFMTGLVVFMCGIMVSFIGWVSLREIGETISQYDESNYYSP